MYDTNINTSIDTNTNNTEELKMENTNIDNTNTTNKKLNTDELKNKYGKVYLIEAELEELQESFTLYFKAPHTASLNRYIKDVSKKPLKAGAVFLKDNIIDEQREELDKIATEYEGLPQSIAAKLLGLLGFTDTLTAKKL